MAVTYAAALTEIVRLHSKPIVGLITPVTGGYDVRVKDSRQENENEAFIADDTVIPGTWKQYAVGAGAGESQTVFV